MTERFLGKHEASFSNVEFCRNLGVWSNSCHGQCRDSTELTVLPIATFGVARPLNSCSAENCVPEALRRIQNQNSFVFRLSKKMTAMPTSI